VLLAKDDVAVDLRKRASRSVADSRTVLINGGGAMVGASSSATSAQLLLDAAVASVVQSEIELVRNVTDGCVVAVVVVAADGRRAERIRSNAVVIAYCVSGGEECFYAHRSDQLNVGCCGWFCCSLFFVVQSAFQFENPSNFYNFVLIL
jgi:hypothetical protein